MTTQPRKEYRPSNLKWASDEFLLKSLIEVSRERFDPVLIQLYNPVIAQLEATLICQELLDRLSIARACQVNHDPITDCQAAPLEAPTGPHTSEGTQVPTEVTGALSGQRQVTSANPALRTWLCST